MHGDRNGEVANAANSFEVRHLILFGWRPASSACSCGPRGGRGRSRASPCCFRSRRYCERACVGARIERKTPARPGASAGVGLRSQASRRKLPALAWALRSVADAKSVGNLALARWSHVGGTPPHRWTTLCTWVARRRCQDEMNSATGRMPNGGVDGREAQRGPSQQPGSHLQPLHPCGSCFVGTNWRHPATVTLTAGKEVAEVPVERIEAFSYRPL